MKRTYETPSAEKIAFCYQEQVAASSGIDGSNGQCFSVWINIGDDGCKRGNTLFEKKD